MIIRFLTGLMYAICLVCFVRTMVFVFTHLTLTQAQLLLAQWQWYLAMVVSGVIGLILGTNKTKGR